MNSFRSLMASMLVLSATLVGCGSDSLAGGGATETGNGLACRILTDSGTAASRAKVIFVRTDTWTRDVQNDGSPQTFPAQADSTGLVRLDRLPEGKWAIQSDRAGLQGWKPLREIDRAEDTLRLARRTLVQGQVSGDSVDRVWVMGTAWSSLVGEGGRYVLAKSAGQYALAGSSRAPIVPLASGISLAGESKTSNLVAHRKAIVLEDFQDGDDKTSLHAYTGIGNWYLTKDAPSRMYSALDSTRPDFRGVLSMQYSLGGSNSYIIAGISFFNEAGYHKLDLSALDSFCLEARGNGQVVVYFQEILDRSGIESSANVSIGTLDSTWRRRCVRPSDFGKSWDSLRTNTTDISFSPRGGNRMEIRQIEFWGPSLLDLSPR
ncbi:MAG: hypothetical protein IPO40_07290 [Fibrobacteres bacterium]|nr:hypothetical protein [Fibrobacterota bacterium]